MTTMLIHSLKAGAALASAGKKRIAPPAGTQVNWRGRKGGSCKPLRTLQQILGQSTSKRRRDGGAIELAIIQRSLHVTIVETVQAIA